MVHFRYYKKEDLKPYLAPRKGETKLGEILQTGVGNEFKFTIIGVPESVGVIKNKGIGGTETLWEDFLKSFCNIQVNEFWPDCLVSIAGSLEVNDQSTVEEIDETVSKLVKEILDSGSLPIVIGGGHNNAYAIIKGCYFHYNDPINVVNLDPHADMRALEGRHSGNGFSYAMAEGMLKKYAVLGLHQNYNAAYMLEAMKSNSNVMYYFYEDIFIKEIKTFDSAIEEAKTFTNTRPIGLEIDLDSIEYSLSSAMTPCGLQSREVRKFLYQMTQNSNIAYLHIAEGASKLHNGQQNPLMGKLVSYLVSDFIKFMNV